MDILVEKMQLAQSKCRKKHIGNIPWSPTYKKINLTLDYWRMRRSYNLGLHKNVRQLIVLQNKLKIQYQSGLSIQDINHFIKDAF